MPDRVRGSFVAENLNGLTIRDSNGETTYTYIGEQAVVKTEEYDPMFTYKSTFEAIRMAHISGDSFGETLIIDPNATQLIPNQAKIVNRAITDKYANFCIIDFSSYYGEVATITQSEDSYTITGGTSGRTGEYEGINMYCAYLE